MKFKENFIGYNESSETTLWVPGDSLENYSLNVRKQPDDWYYKDRNITYSFNRYGHRCKDIEEIDLSNYILFLGCSHTMGVGLELETTYPYLISKEIGCDYYNLGLAGTGIDVLEYNLISWINTVNSTPRAVVIQWPDFTRFISYNTKNNNFIECGTWTKEKDCHKFIVTSEKCGFLNSKKILTMKLIENLVKVPVHQCIFTSHPSFNAHNLYLRKIDLARDLSHSGIKSHQAWSEMLVKEILKA